MAKNSMDFGKFLSGLASDASPATAETIKGLQEKMEKERQEQLELRVRAVFNRIQLKVSELREHRKREDIMKKNISDLEALANKIVKGEDLEAADLSVLPEARYW